MALPNVCKYKFKASGPNGIGLNFGAHPHEFDTWVDMFQYGDVNPPWLAQYDNTPADFAHVTNDPDRNGMYHRKAGEWVCVDGSSLNGHYRIVNTASTVTYSTVPATVTNDAGLGSVGFPSIMYDPLRVDSLDIYDVATSSFDVSKLKEGELFRLDVALVITPVQLGQEITFTLRWGGEDTKQSHYLVNEGAGEPVPMYLTFMLPLVVHELASLIDRVSLLVSCDAGSGEMQVTDMTVKITKRKY